MAFFSQISRRHLSTSIRMAAKIQEIVVIGGGLMGAGIAQVVSKFKPLGQLFATNAMVDICITCWFWESLALWLVYDYVIIWFYLWLWCYLWLWLLFMIMMLFDLIYD